MLKKILVLIFLMVIFVGVIAKLYAAWVNCSGPYPGTCTQGGCESPQYAYDCWLFGCLNGKGGNVKCTKPGGDGEEPPPIYPEL